MTNYSKPITRTNLVEFRASLEFYEGTRKMVRKIAKKYYNELSDYKMMKEARKVTGLDVLMVTKGKFIIRYN